MSFNSGGKVHAAGGYSGQCPLVKTSATKSTY